MNIKNFEQTWWNENLPNEEKLNEYLNWLGDYNAYSRIFIREEIKNLKVKSIADFGCGPALEYLKLKEENYKFDYLGIDSAKVIEENSKKMGIPFLFSNIEKVDLNDNSYEMSYGRHVLEHQSHYKKTLNEMIRVAKKYVIHIFFIPPQDKEKINFWKEENLYHNQYSQKDIEEYIMKNKKVKSYEWFKLDEKENVLIIKLKDEVNIP